MYEGFNTKMKGTCIKMTEGQQNASETTQNVGEAVQNVSEIKENVSETNETTTPIVEETAETSVLDMDLSQITLEKLETMDEKEIAEAKESVVKMIKECREALKVFYAYEKAHGLSMWEKLKTYISGAEKYLRIVLYIYVAYMLYQGIKSIF